MEYNKILIAALAEIFEEKSIKYGKVLRHYD